MRTWETAIDMTNRIARKMGAREVDAMDFAQEAVLRLCRKYPEENKRIPSKRAFGLLKTICHNLVIDTCNKAGREKIQTQSVARNELSLLGWESTKCISDYCQLSRVTENGTGHLPEHYVSVVVLRLEGNTHREISDRLLMPLGTVKTILRRASLRRLPPDVVQT